MSIRCVKEFSIKIRHKIWQQMVWTKSGILYQNGGQIGTFEGAAYQDVANISQTVVAPTGALNTAGFSGSNNGLIATFNNVDPPISANLNVVLQNDGSGIIDYKQNWIILTVNGIDIVDIQATDVPAGTYNYPFTIPSGIVTLSCQFSIQAQARDGGSVSASCLATFSTS